MVSELEKATRRIMKQRNIPKSLAQVYAVDAISNKAQRQRKQKKRPFGFF